MVKMKITASFMFLLFVAFSSCKKETTYIYHVNDEHVQQPGGDKENVKSTTEFISIAYSDLFNTTIPNDTLVALDAAYTSFGDKKLIEDMIIRHFLNSPNVQLPSDSVMNANVPQFVSETYRKFLNRDPNEFEKYFITNIIQGNTNVTPVLVYYAMMTSNEYRYY
jgi:hypothetical protein